jgi:sulfatase maturation enzyme AslB (radical SAM superfamily)
VLEFFCCAIELAERCLRHDQRAENTIPTNGTLLDPEWAKF